MSVKNSNKSRYRFQVSMLHPAYWLTWLGLFVFFIITLLPMSFVDAIGCRLGQYAARKNKKRFRIVKTNLSLCFPDKTEAEIDNMVLQNFQAQFRSLLHYYILWWRPIWWVKKKIQLQGFDKIPYYQQQGKQVIILLTHNVGLDFATAAISMSGQSNGPYKQVRNPVIDWLIANGRLRFSKTHGGKLFTREDGLRPLIRETRKGKVLVYLADEDLGEKNSLFVPFFGVPKATIPVLGRLAKACGAVILPCVSCYDAQSRRYSVKLFDAIENITGNDDEVDSINMNRAIEMMVEQCPVQYFWALRYFQTRPPGEASFYD